MTMMEAHRDLESRFLEHQVALIERDAGKAHRNLLAFRSLLLDHMEEEERVVFPLFQELCGDPPGGRRELFEVEHANIRRQLDVLVERVSELSRAAAPGMAPRDILDLLDRAWPLKGLLLHHELRERNVLYPALDEALDERARRDFWQSIARLRLERQGRDPGMSSEGRPAP